MKPPLQAADSLGPVTHTFSPSQLNLLAGFVLAFLLCAGGIVSAVAFAGPTPDGRLALWVGFAAVAAGVTCLAYTLTLVRRRLDLCERGFRCHSLAGTREVPWKEIDHIRHLVVEDRTNADSVAIRTREGKTYRFTANHVRDFPAFLTALQGHTKGTAPAVGAGSVAGGPSRVRWRLLSERAIERWWNPALLGAFLVVSGPILFLALSAAESRTAVPVRLQPSLYLLYNLGGKWLAAGTLFAVGCFFVAKGVRRRRSEADRGVEER